MNMIEEALLKTESCTEVVHDLEKREGSSKPNLRMHTILIRARNSTKEQETSQLAQSFFRFHLIFSSKRATHDEHDRRSSLENRVMY